MLESKSCSVEYNSGRSAFESYLDWNKKYKELLNVMLGVRSKTNPIDYYGHPHPHYDEAKKVAENRFISPIAVYKAVVANRLKLVALREAETSDVVIYDLNRAVAVYDIYLHDKGVPFTMNTALEISVPSGKLLVTDNFGDHFVPEGKNEGESAFMHNLAVRHMNEYKIATARIDDFPKMIKNPDGSFVFTTLDEEDTVLDGETIIKYNETGLYDYSVEMMDYGNWLEKVGTNLEGNRNYSLIDVEPGLYLWTVYSHNQEFYEIFYEKNPDLNKRRTYAKLELVKGY